MAVRDGINDLLAGALAVLEAGSRDDQVRALRVLEALGPESAPAVPAVSRKLEESTDPILCETAASTLGGIGPAAAPAVGALGKIITGERGFALHGCNFLGEATIRALGDIRTPQAVEALLKVPDLYGPDSWLFPQLQVTLCELGSKAREAAPLIRQLLTDERWTEERSSLEDVLHSIDKGEEETRRRFSYFHGRGGIDFAEGSGAFTRFCPALRGLLEEGNDTVRQTALHAVQAIGPDAAPLTPQIAALLEDQGSLGLWWLAGWAVEAIGRGAGDAVPALERIIGLRNDPRLVKDDDYRTALHRAVCALGFIASPRAVPVLLELATSPDARRHQTLAIYGLGRIEPPPAEAVPVLLDLFHRGSADVREGVLRSLGNMKAGASAALPVLSGYLGNAEFREAHTKIIYALGDISPASGPVVPVLLSRLEPSQPREIRKAAARALYHALFNEGAMDRELPGVFLRYLEDPDEDVLEAGLHALEHLGDARAVPVLLRRLGEAQSPSLKALLAGSLARLGAADPAVLEALKKLEASDPGVCKPRVRRRWS